MIFFMNLENNFTKGKKMRRAKIVCTIGPASSSPDMLEKLILSGMNVARLNFSHGTHELHGKVIDSIREISGRLEKPVAVLQDLAGPKIRTGIIVDGPVILKSGQKFCLTARDVQGNSSEVSITYKELPADVLPGDTLLLCDGSIEMEVKETKGEDIICKVIVGGPLDSHKGINLPDRSIQAEILSEKDRKDLAFGLRKEVDYIALSFVRNVEDVRLVRKIINDSGYNTSLIAKIEKHEALNNIDEIIKEVDGIMVARGDLGVEIPIETVPRVQKRLIRKANQSAKPVITATQMLKSMVDNPRPTRAEVTDVANAILDGSDAVMLSEETAVGKYPVETVKMMSKIAVSIEQSFPFREWAERYRKGSQLSAPEAVALSACQIAESIRASAIVATTKSGSTTRLVAKYRPIQTILAITPDECTFHRLALVWGAHPVLMKQVETTDDLEKNAIDLACRTGYVKKDSQVVLIAGVPLYVSGTTNLIKITNIGIEDSKEG